MGAFGHDAAMARLWAALAIVYLVWGSTYLGIDVASESLPPLLMLAARFLVAGAILYAVVGRGVRTTIREWAAATVVGALLLSAGTSGVALAEQRIDTGLAALIVAMVPLWMAVLDRAVWGRTLSRAGVVGIAIGLGGVALLVNPAGAGGRELVGALIPVAGSFCWAFGSLWSRTAPLPENTLVAAAMEMIGGGAVLIVASLAAGEHVRFAEITERSVLGLAYLVVFGSLVAYSAYAWLLQRAPASLVSTYAYVNPVVAVALGAVVLGEPVTWTMAAGGAAIVTAVVLLVSTQSRASEAEVVTLEHEPALERAAA
jgi:drug/metabolite transporter (DMT)-like permease